MMRRKGIACSRQIDRKIGWGEISRRSGGGKAAAGGGRHQCVCGADGGGDGISRAVSFGRRRGGELAGDAGPGDQHDGRCADGCPAHHGCDSASVAGGYRYGMGRRIQHCADDSFHDQGGRGGRAHGRPGGAKRCGHRPGKELVPAEEMVDRIKAAVDARTDERFVLMARTDALASEGLKAAIERAQAYVGGGGGHDFCRSGYGTGDVHGVPQGGGRSDPGEYHRVWADAAVDARGAGQRGRGHYSCIAARLIGR